MNNAEQVITQILSSSCTPANDLLAAVETGQVDQKSALALFNRRLRNKVYSLHDAAQTESDFMRYHDI